MTGVHRIKFFLRYDSFLFPIGVDGSKASLAGLEGDRIIGALEFRPKMKYLSCILFESPMSVIPWLVCVIRFGLMIHFLVSFLESTIASFPFVGQVPYPCG